VFKNAANLCNEAKFYQRSMTEEAEENSGQIHEKIDNCSDHNNPAKNNEKKEALSHAGSYCQ
jgi:hypothetical protein